MQAWDFATPEARDGIRFSWNVWPSQKLEAAKCMVPLGCLYTPLKAIEGMPRPLEYDPIRCLGCSAALNPYVQVDYQSKLWTCCFCQTRNNFPPHYRDNITEQNLPAELIPQYTSVEYELQVTSFFGTRKYL
jgi:protein transport protein SEC23